MDPTPQPNSPAPQSAPPTSVPGSDIPSSLSSVSVRTMESDVESLKKTGGINPVPEIVNSAPFNQTAEPQANSGVSTQTPIPMSAPAKSSLVWIWWAVGLAAIFLLGYFILPMFLK